MHGLNQEQVDEFDDRGFIVVNDVFDHDEIERFRVTVEAPEIRTPQNAKGYDEKLVHMVELAARHSVFLALAKSDKIVAKVRQLIGDDIQLQHSKIATQPPSKGRGGIRLHQDFAFFPHTNTDLVAVMVMLDDATPENGCMKMVPASHKLGCLDHMGMTGFFDGGCVENQHWTEPGQLVDITPRAGGISIHHCLTLHGAFENISGRQRRGLVFQYRADDAMQLADMVFADTGILVAGKRRSKVRCSEGVWQLPLRKFKDCPYGTSWNQLGEKAAFWDGRESFD
jgi:phytanoyl-CoA hydroxylase